MEHRRPSYRSITGTTSHRRPTQVSSGTGSQASCRLVGDIKAYCVMIMCRAMLLRLVLIVLELNSITVISVKTTQYQRAALAANSRNGPKSSYYKWTENQVYSALTLLESIRQQNHCAVCTSYNMKKAKRQHIEVYQSRVCMLNCTVYEPSICCDGCHYCVSHFLCFV